MATQKKRGTLDKKATAKPSGDKAFKGSPKPDEVAPEPQPMNREERRRAQFGKHRHAATPTTPWPQSETNPAFGRGGDDQEAYTGRPDQDVTKTTGPGTGGATEEPTQRPAHEGTHAGQSTKG